MHETNELTDQITKLRDMYSSSEPNFAKFFGYDVDDPELDQDPVTDLDVYVDIALQILRVRHLLANAEEALDSPLRPIRARVQQAKGELVNAYETHMPDDAFSDGTGHQHEL